MHFLLFQPIGDHKHSHTHQPVRSVDTKPIKASTPNGQKMDKGTNNVPSISSVWDIRPNESACLTLTNGMGVGQRESPRDSSTGSDPRKGPTASGSFSPVDHTRMNGAPGNGSNLTANIMRSQERPPVRQRGPVHTTMTIDDPTFHELWKELVSNADDDNEVNRPTTGDGN